MIYILKEVTLNQYGKEYEILLGYFLNKDTAESYKKTKEDSCQFSVRQYPYWVIEELELLEKSDLNVVDTLTDLVGMAQTALNSLMVGAIPSHGILDNMADILEVADGVFENRSDAMEWLLKPLDKLNGESPYNLLKTESGKQKVLDLLRSS